MKERTMSEKTTLQQVGFHTQVAAQVHLQLF